jgi:hypothetical protein
MLLFLLSAFSFLLSTLGLAAHFSFLLSAFNFFPAVLLVLLLSVYGLCVLAASIVTAKKTEWKLLPALPLVFPCYHFGYGYGFLRGIWSFVIFRRGASDSFTKLTRSSPKEEAC